MGKKYQERIPMSVSSAVDLKKDHFDIIAYLIICINPMVYTV